MTPRTPERTHWGLRTMAVAISAFIMAILPMLSGGWQAQHGTVDRQGVRPVVRSGSTTMNSAMNTLVNTAVYQQQPSFPLPVPEHPVPAMTVIGRGIEFTNRLAPALPSRLLWRLWFTPQ